MPMNGGVNSLKNQKCKGNIWQKQNNYSEKKNLLKRPYSHVGQQLHDYD